MTSRAGPGRWVHEGTGEPFTSQESALANSATPAELATALRLAAASFEHFARKRDDLARVMQLVASVPGWEDLEIFEAVERLPMPEQAEAVELLSRYSPVGLQG